MPHERPVGIGTIAGHVGAGDRIGVIYFDTHADLNVPASVPEGALDWMGMAHMLGEPGAVGEPMRALKTLVASPKLAGLTVTELNPDHAEAGAGTLERFASALAGSLAAPRTSG